jgi:hypothetical protein
MPPVTWQLMREAMLASGMKLLIMPLDRRECFLAGAGSN